MVQTSVWPRNEGAKGLQFVYEKEDMETLDEKRITRPGSTLFNQTFHIYGLHLDFLPRRLGFWYYNKHLSTNKLRCDSTFHSHKYDRDCWCSCIEEIQKKGAKQVVKMFEAPSTTDTLIYRIRVEMKQTDTINHVNM